MNKKEKWNLELSEYIIQGEPSRVEKTRTWETAIGLQDVDGLKPSEYLIKTAKEHIEGNIDLKEVKNRINHYYKVLDNRKAEEAENSEEADKVAVRITELLSEKSFNFNPTELINIHQRLFSGVYKHAGKIREYNFSKEEWILNDDTVVYAPYETILPALQLMAVNISSLRVEPPLANFISLPVHDNSRVAVVVPLLTPNLILPLSFHEQLI